MENPGFSSPAEKLILIVDDEKGIRELLEVVVRKEGFRTELAEDGHEAIEKARRILPDLILLDLMLPKSGGFEVVRELQAEETAAIPIIVITGRFMDHTTTDMIRRETNVREYVQKPIKMASLTSLLHQILKTRPAMRKMGQ